MCNPALTFMCPKTLIGRQSDYLRKEVKVSLINDKVFHVLGELFQTLADQKKTMR